jgi:hypothetical protein
MDVFELELQLPQAVDLTMSTAQVLGLEQQLPQAVDLQPTISQQEDFFFEL